MTAFIYRVKKLVVNILVSNPFPFNLFFKSSKPKCSKIAINVSYTVIVHLRKPRKIETFSPIVHLENPQKSETFLPVSIYEL